jgi:hypothetical protein
MQYSNNQFSFPDILNCLSEPYHTIHIGVINREDVAALVVQALGSTTCTRMELTAIDPSQPSAYNYEKNVKPHKF